MIIQEQINETFIKTYSDQHVYIHGGFPEADYTEAIDPINMNRVYTETDIPIPYAGEEINPEEAKDAVRILLDI